jgi:hypothetical protein
MAPELREVEQHLKEIKLELKKSKRIDFYGLLEVSSTATDYEIKKVCVRYYLCRFKLLC